MSTIITDRIHKGNYQISSYEDLININPSFKREGYQISSWNTKSDGSGITILTSDVLKISSDNTLYAIWKKLGLIMTSINGIKCYFDASDTSILSSFGYVDSNGIVQYPYISHSEISSKNYLVDVNDNGNEITAIKDYSLYGCERLSSINAKEVVEIGNHAFGYCYALLSVSFPSAKTIGVNAFEECAINLEYVNIPEALEICSMAFFNCTGLTTINMQKVEIINSGAFYECGLQSIDIPNVDFIHDGAFEECKDLSSIILSSQNNPTTLGNSVFTGCPSDFTVWVKNETYKQYLTETNWMDISSHISSMTQPTVSFLSGNTYDTLVKTEKLNYAMSAIPPMITREGYELTGWNGNYNDVTRDVSCYAQWSEMNVLKTSENDFITDDGDNLIEYA